MLTKEIKLEYKVYQGFEEFQDIERALLLAAREATHLSHAPYSEFYVGAAVLLDGETILKGANQENASYPLCNCAEQVSLNHAMMAYPGSTVHAMAVAVNTDKDGFDLPVSPCGACRQIILEQEHRQSSDMKIYLVSKTDVVYVFDSIKSLIPLYFQFK